ncbi:TniB family NTP-binding protein [Ruegeria arenilitoris]|uniref:TniB family NTP-binding protein n=1 Tax=Ruegeria arenilitoris TaxID=1173585 RepID=UPI0034643A4E
MFTIGTNNPDLPTCPIDDTHGCRRKTCFGPQCRLIAFDRSNIVLNRLTSLMRMPIRRRMPSLMFYGSSEIGKTMIAKRMASL